MKIPQIQCSTAEQDSPLDLSKTSNNDYPNPNQPREPVFICNTCKINFSTQQRLNSHFCRPRKCKWCNEFFVEPEAAREHYFRVHYLK